jgi:hypothetical protein
VQGREKWFERGVFVCLFCDTLSIRHQFGMHVCLSAPPPSLASALTKVKHESSCPTHATFHTLLRSRPAHNRTQAATHQRNNPASSPSQQPASPHDNHNMAQRAGLVTLRAVRRTGALARQLAPAQRAAAAVVAAPLHTTAKASVSVIPCLVLLA